MSLDRRPRRCYRIAMTLNFAIILVLGIILFITLGDTDHTDTDAK